MQFCPGTTYFFRAREVYGGFTFSGWTANFTFTTPGVFIPPTGFLIATPPVILACPAGNSQLSFSCTNCCGIPPYSYTWTPAASLSCSTCASPIATPSVTTIYTLNMNGGKLGCWGITNTVQVTVINTPPVVGTAADSSDKNAQQCLEIAMEIKKSAYLKDRDITYLSDLLLYDNH